ncbi:MAG: tRNA (N(6)-L-threonylcarbamoyladenosine(37)-C(2))-methylthiotransferase MtaB [Clostridia bacterium]|nr:tRNA (N(6)-L-threonylcarbamoyladenosine(37)-C(2))-methylthiotransferase MtaB [Clostridia bacterium]
MKAVVFTLGCKVNSQESASLITGLNEIGYQTSTKLEWADIYVINTCAVTGEAEKKSRQAIARVRKFNQDAKIYVCGCASQKNPQSFIDKGVQVVVGTNAKDKLLEHLNDSGIFIEADKEYYQKYLPCKSSHTREYIKIQDGCNNFCSYCIIPYLRGRSRSRSIENIVEEIKYLSPAEAVITGINVSAYEYNGKKLPDLINALSQFDCRIRFGSLEVVSITEELMLACKNLNDFAPHFHLSLQSGSDSVLKSMNRRYTTAEYADKVQLIRRYYPDAAITTDIIVGYSTESDQNFEETLNFCDQINFADIHCFPYSVREGTAGAKLKKLPDEIKRARLEKLMQKKAELKNRFIEKQVGQVLSFIPEEYENGYTVGYTANYIRTYVHGKLPLKKCFVKLICSFNEGALCELV